MNWVKKLNQLIAGANSKTGMRVEQSEWSRTTTTSVEVTFETDEIILFESVQTAPAGTVVVAPERKSDLAAADEVTAAELTALPTFKGCEGENRDD